MPRRCLVAAAQERVRAYPSSVVPDHRRRLLTGACGRVLDLSLRPEANRPMLLTGDVTELTAVAGGPPLAQLWDSPPGDGSEGVAAVHLMTGPLHADTFAAGSFDTVVSVTTLCTVDHPVAMLSAVGRWLSPGGRLLLLEHVRATGFTGIMQTALSPFEQVLTDGCHLDQDVVGGCREAELDLTDVTRFTSRVVGGMPVPFVAGVARPRSRYRRPSPRPAAEEA
jgi:SAM-dependent methyltransferase